jgi:Tfp pilus assembly protein PilF
VSNLRQDIDVQQWYRATFSHKLARELLDIHHFEHGLRLFPDNVDVLFLNGCLREALADPRVQALRAEASLPRGTSLEVQTEQAELRLAEGLFRRALDRQPGHVEARVRYGRTLARLGRPSDAAAALRLAREDTREPLLEYYGALFLGGAELALNRPAEAERAYQQALTLFPRAQAPRLGLSQLASRAGNRASARDLLRPVLERDAPRLNDDPWWTYRLSAGRQSTELLDAAYRALSGTFP